MANLKDTISFNYEASLSPKIPDTIKSKQIILTISRDSPNRAIPKIATPTAPMPVHTAYAVPTGIVFMAADNKPEAKHHSCDCQ